MMTECATHEFCVTSALDSAEKICAEKKLKFTSIRRRVLELVWDSHKPAKAYQILEKLSETDGAPMPPTVYRALDFLLDNGFVHRINTLNAFVGCSHPGAHNQCYFLICTECEEVTECCTSTIGNAIDSSAKDNSFTTESASVEIRGKCQSCNG